MGTEWIAPTISGLLLLAAGIVAGIFSRVNKRREIRDQATPDAWTAAEHARAAMFAWQDLYYLVRGALKGYARRMQERHGDAAALTDEERAALEAPTPDTKKEQ